MRRQRFTLLLFLFVAIDAASGAAQQGPATKAALDEIAQARENLRAVEAAHPGDTKETVEALRALVTAQMDHQEATNETVALASRERAMALAVAGTPSETYAQALVDSANADAWLNRAAEGRGFAESALEMAQAELHDLDIEIEAADSLAFVCMDLEDLSCALHANQVAIAGERKGGPAHDRELASSLSQIGDVFERSGKPAEAGAAIEESLAVQTRVAPDAPDIGILESNLGAHYLRNQEFSKAQPHLMRALALLSRNYGDDSDYARGAMLNLADIYTRTGQFPMAWKNYELAIGNKSATIETLARIRANYARSLASGGRLQEAIDQGLKAAQMGRENFVLQARVLPERQALSYVAERPRGLDTALSVVVRYPKMDAEATYQEIVRSRALVADEMARRQKNLNAANDPEVARLLGELGQAQAGLLAAEQEAQGKEAQSNAVAEATARTEKIERSLAEHSATIRNDERVSAVQIADVRESLPPHGVLVSYVAFQRRIVGAVDPARTDTPAYMAFVLHPDDKSIRVFDLGDAKPIDELVARVRASATAEAQGSGLASMRNEREYREAGDALRKRIWDPLKPELEDATLVLVVPDGSVNLVPLSSLPSGSGYLVEHSPVIHMLTSERDLVIAESAQRKTGLLALGSPAFELAGNAGPPAPLRDAEAPCEGYRDVGYDPLPGTGIEVADLASAWRRWESRESATLLMGEDATRDRFVKEAGRNRVLHVATHAFVLGSNCADDNPLLHSGLVFAGANEMRGSAILTARQIASLDLNGVDLAVLSACNTGNGELRDGEGVLGLERAFRIAGVRSVLMTLWPVDDDSAQRFMHHFYTMRLGQHASIADAVWESARNLLAERRAAGKSTHPWYWAGFVGSGRWE